MAFTEQPTFYDQHPFDWIVAGVDTDIRSVVSPALADLIERLEYEFFSHGRWMRPRKSAGVPCPS